MEQPDVPCYRGGARDPTRDHQGRHAGRPSRPPFPPLAAKSALQLVGVKAVRAFDGWVVIARLSGEGPKSQRLLGAAPCETDEELPHAAVQAVLDATNRVLEGGLL